ncbi:MAG: riboflavin kinase [Patescibacteria group bacterium]
MFSGIVIRGEGVARRLGYPTANLDIHPDATKLKAGVYAAHAFVAQIKYGAALVIQTAIPKVEVYLYDYPDTDLYGEIVSVDAIQKVSEIEPLQEEALKKKVENDIRMIREFLKKNLESGIFIH